MKKIVTICCAGLLLAGCARTLDVVDPNQGRKTYTSYGLLNSGSYRSDRVCYSVSAGNVVWSIILIETIVFPIYFIGFSIMNPVGLKNAHGDCGPDL